METRDSVARDLPRQALVCEVSKCYKSFVVRSRLKRVPNKAMKCIMFEYEEEVPRFSHRYIVSQVPGWALAMVKAWDAQGLSGTLPWSLYLLSWSTGSGVLLTSSAFRKRKQLAASVWLLNTKSVMCWSRLASTITRTWWYSLQSVLEIVTHVCAYSDGYVQPLGCPGSHPW